MGTTTSRHADPCPTPTAADADGFPRFDSHGTLTRSSRRADVGVQGTRRHPTAPGQDVTR